MNTALAEGSDASDANEVVTRAMASTEVPWPAATVIDTGEAADVAVPSALTAIERGR